MNFILGTCTGRKFLLETVCNNTARDASILSSAELNDTVSSDTDLVETV